MATGDPATSDEAAAGTAGNVTARALAVADKIGVCARLANLWVGHDLHSKVDGDLFNGTGALWNCNERLCPSCLAERSRKARKTAREAIARPRLQKGELWRFVTLTMPTLPADQSPLFDTIKVVARAWRLFSKRDWWKRTVSAGVKGVEFTLGNPWRLKNEGREWSPVTDGYHVHVHLLVLSGWVEWRKLRQEWSECLRESWDEFGLHDQRINTKDGLAVCDVRLVTKRKGGRGSISGEGAICEVAKYITKCESWDHVPESQLLEVASIERWPRMFELLGGCRAPSQPRAKDPNAGYVDVEEAPRPEVTVQDRLRELWDSGDFASLHLFASIRSELAQGSLSDESFKVLRDSTAYLDTPNLSGGGKPRAGPLIPPRQKRRSIREIGTELIAAGSRQLWKRFLALTVGERQGFRRDFQSRTFPFATFRDLAGRSWFGMRVCTKLQLATPDMSITPAIA